MPSEEPDGYWIPREWWPVFQRLMRDYIGGKLSNHPPPPGGRRGGRTGVKIGRTVESIEKGKKGNIVRLKGEQGEERRSGRPFEAYNRFGDLESDADVAYVRTSNGYEILQSWCDPFEFSDDPDEDDSTEEEEESS